MFGGKKKKSKKYEQDLAEDLLIPRANTIGTLGQPFKPPSEEEVMGRHRLLNAGLAMDTQIMRQEMFKREFESEFAPSTAFSLRMHGETVGNIEYIRSTGKYGFSGSLDASAEALFRMACEKIDALPGNEEREKIRKYYEMHDLLTRGESDG